MISTSLLLPLSLMIAQGTLGAIDTIYYHEWRYRLTAHPEHAAHELALHGVRDCIYGVFFFTVPSVAWHGLLTVLLVVLLAAEIAITLVDFVIERRVRRPWGGLAAGELVMHTIMAILYGAFLVTLSPHLVEWYAQPTGWVAHTTAIPGWLRVVAGLIGVGVSLAGLRDLAVAAGSKRFRWPWTGEARLRSPPGSQQ